MLSVIRQWRYRSPCLEDVIIQWEKQTNQLKIQYGQNDDGDMQRPLQKLQKTGYVTQDIKGESRSCGRSDERVDTAMYADSTVG